MSIPKLADDASPSQALGHLLKVLGPLFKLPTRKAAAAGPAGSTPTRAALEAFLEAIPEAAIALPDLVPAEEGTEGPTGQELSVARQRVLAKAGGRLALWAVGRVDDLIRADEAQAPAGAPPAYPVSTAPLLMLLLARATGQYLQPLFVGCAPAVSAVKLAPTKATQRFTELPDEDEDTARDSSSAAPQALSARSELVDAVHQVLALASRQPFTLVTQLVRDVGVMRPVLKIAVSLGWQSDREDQTLQTTVVSLLDLYHPSQTMSLLTPLLARSSGASVPISRLLSRALLRPDGLRGLLQSMFAVAASADTQEPEGMRRAEAWAKLVASPPSGKAPAEAVAYVRTIVPRLLDLLKATDTPTAFARPVALALTRLIRSHPPLVLVHLHGPFIRSNLDLTARRQCAAAAKADERGGDAPSSAQFEALCVIVPLVLNAPPSSTIADRLLTPIMPPLLALDWHLRTVKTADPILRAHVRDLCATWGRTANERDVEDVLRRAVFGGRGWRTEGLPVKSLHEGPVPANILGGDDDAADDGEAEWHWVGGGQDLAVRFGLPPQPDLSTASEPSPLAGPSSAPGGGPPATETDEADTFEREALAMLDLQPPPALFVDFLKTIKRPKPTGALFIGLLGRLHRPTDDETSALGPLGELLLSKLTLRMVEILGEDLIKGEAERILESVNLVLRSSGGPPDARPTRTAPARDAPYSSFGLADLRIVEDEPIDRDDGGGETFDSNDELDSDDEPDLPPLEDSEAVGLDDGRDASGTAEGKMGIVGTAVGLLIAVLQADGALSPVSNPLIVVIKASLERHVASSTLPAVRHLCQEALLILSLRSAASSLHGLGGPSTPRSAQDGTAAALERYQEALRLIADPSVPVRAHGLILLRQLVLPSAQQQRERPSAAPSARLPDALIPAIADVFVQSIQDSDSYVYLNAVKGLAGMVDGHGRDVLGRLTDVYIKGVGSNVWTGRSNPADVKGKGRATGRSIIGEIGEMDAKDLDTRLRVGEALCGVIERCDRALGQYGDVLIPPMLLVFRAARLPTSLRASAFSVLTLIAETSPLTFLTYLNNLVLASVDLLQVETVARPRSMAPAGKTDPSARREGGEVDSDDEADQVNLPLEDRPATVADAKHPMLRRTALKFLGAALVADSQLDRAEVDRATWGRVSTVVGYVRATDIDPHVRSIAGEVGILLKERLLALAT